MFNSWMVSAPTVLVIVWTYAYFWRKELIAHPTRRKYWRRGTSAFCGVGLLVFLHLESHRGGVQLMRNWSSDPNGINDLEYAFAVSCAFILVAILYAYLMSFGIECIVERSIKKMAAKHVASNNTQPSAEKTQPAVAGESGTQAIAEIEEDPEIFWKLDGTRSDAQSAASKAQSRFTKPMLVFDEFYTYSLASLTIALEPGQKRIYSIPCKQRYVGKYELTEEEYLFLVLTAPYELQGKVEILDEEPQGSEGKI